MNLLRIIRGDLRHSAGAAGAALGQLQAVFGGTPPHVLEEQQLAGRFRTRPDATATEGPVDLDSGVVRIRPARRPPEHPGG